MEKVKLSSRQVEDIRNTVARHLKKIYNVLQGQLLTTMDSVVENDRQVEGIKARVKDIQGQTWDEMYRQREIVLGSIFFSDATKTTKEDAFEVGKAMDRFITDLNSMIVDDFRGFQIRLKNLIGMIFSDSKLKCVVREVAEIVHNSQSMLISGIARGLGNKFNVPTDDVR